MRRLEILGLALAIGLAAQTPAQAQQVPDLVTAKDLLTPCQEADNDPRDGIISQLECMRFIGGVVAAVETTGAVKLCVPETNRHDALRRAYVSWVHASFTKRSKLPVGEAVINALSDSFECS